MPQTADLHRHWPGLVAALRTADAGSFSAAARALDITPAAVGKAVAQLEARLGLRLFNRTTRQLALTAEGAQVLAHARSALAALEAMQAQGEALRAGAGLAGLVRISSAVGFGRRHVLPAVAGLLAQHPGLRIDLQFSDLSADLVREGFDIGIRGGVEPPAGMVARKLATLPTVLVASAAYLARAGQPRDWQALARHRLIGVRFASGRSTPWQFRSGAQVVAFAPQPVLQLSAPEMLIDAVLADLGIAQVGLHHAEDALRSGQVQRVLAAQYQPRSVPLAIFYPHRAGLAPRVRAVVEHLTASLRGALAGLRALPARETGAA